MEISVTNRQRGVPVDVSRLRRFAAVALPLCQDRPGPGAAPLPDLEGVEIVLVSDQTSARLHTKFLGEPGPTDVITFAHGEIVIGCGVGLRQAVEHGEEFTRELCRYLVHGLLHLNGHEDDQPDLAAAMWQAQEEILGRAEAALPP